MKFINLTMLKSNKVSVKDKELDVELQKSSKMEVRRLLSDKKITAEDFVFTDTSIIPFNMENAISMEPETVEFPKFEFAGSINVKLIDESLLRQVTKIYFVGGKEVLVEEDLETIKKLLGE